MGQATALLAIDPGTKCGWAFWRSGWCRPESGIRQFDLQRGESQGMRFIRFRQWLEELMALKPDIVLYEQAHHRGGAATEIMIGMATRIQEIAEMRGIEYRPVHSATLKKWTTGNGKADKSSMCSRARAMWSVDPIDDNEADALCILAYGLQLCIGVDMRQR